MIRSLQSLRGLFTIVIFLGHYPFSLAATFSTPSDCAVSFFLILSGFVMCAAHERKMEKEEYRFLTFMRGRLMRLYPLHLICLTAALAINHFHTFPLQIISHLLLVQSWIPEQEVYFGLNGVSWFLSTLMFCYLLLFPAVRLATRRPGAYLSTLAAAVAAYLAAAPLVPADMATWALYVCPLPRALDFLIGIALYQIYKKVKPALEPSTAPYPCIAAIVSAMALVSAPAVRETYTLACWWWIPMSLLILSFALCDQSRWPLARLTNSNLPVNFGQHELQLLHVARSHSCGRGARGRTDAPESSHMDSHQRHIRAMRDGRMAVAQIHRTVRNAPTKSASRMMAGNLQGDLRG